jgi:hypothetical protein
VIAKAIEAAVPVESLERLLAMRTDLKRELAREAYSRALAEFQAAIPPIAKTKTARVNSRNGGSYSYHYADIATIQRAIAPRLQESGLSVTFDTRQEADTLHVVCIVHHVDGHSEQTAFPVPIDRQARMNDTQKVGSALTYGRRYALCAALGIVTAEGDDDAQTAGSNPPPPGARSSLGAPTGSVPPGRHNGTRHTAEAAPAAPEPAPTAPTPVAAPARAISDAQHRRLEARIRDLSLDRERVKSWVLRAWGVAHLAEIPADRYSELDRRLNDWAAQQPPLTEHDRSAALAEAKAWGWSGARADLLALAQQMAAQAAADRKTAAALEGEAQRHGLAHAKALECTASALHRIAAEKPAT